MQHAIVGNVIKNGKIIITEVELLLESSGDFSLRC
jgi:hypothetical protein